MLGIDVSNNQGTIDWRKVARDPQRISFAYCKATEGTTFRDGTYARNRAGCKTNGIAFGAYHFARPGRDAAAQARHFAQFAAPRAGELLPMLDLEESDGLGVAALRTWTGTFLKTMSELGLRCGVYTTPSFAVNVPQTTAMGQRPLWIAHVGAGGKPKTTPPTIPPPWKQAAFWQFTWKARVQGVAGDVDMDRLVTPTDPLAGYRVHPTP